ncbi:hypothetical protein ACFC3Y_08585 [Bacillus wiedmannii]|uniref:hypothetical protein n=1 Tax=Bacillus wiedmannii TaxID=1890302 RepID=UPI0035DA88AB
MTLKEIVQLILPFISSIVGALTGGLITYGIFKTTEKKKDAQKCLESLSEIYSQTKRLYADAADLKIYYEYNLSNGLVEKTDAFLNVKLYNAEIGISNKAIYIDSQTRKHIQKFFITLSEQIVDYEKRAKKTSKLESKYEIRIKQMHFIVSHFVELEVFLQEKQEYYYNLYSKKFQN